MGSNEAQDLNSILLEAEDKISSISASKELEDLRVHYLGKSGVVTSQLKVISTLPPESRKDFGAKVNIIKNKNF